MYFAEFVNCVATTIKLYDVKANLLGVANLYDIVCLFMLWSRAQGGN